MMVWRSSLMFLYSLLPTTNRLYYCFIYIYCLPLAFSSIIVLLWCFVFIVKQSRCECTGFHLREEVSQKYLPFGINSHFHGLKNTLTNDWQAVSRTSVLFPLELIHPGVDFRSWIGIWPMMSWQILMQAKVKGQENKLILQWQWRVKWNVNTEDLIWRCNPLITFKYRKGRLGFACKNFKQTPEVLESDLLNKRTKTNWMMGNFGERKVQVMINSKSNPASKR